MAHNNSQNLKESKKQIISTAYYQPFQQPLMHNVPFHPPQKDILPKAGYGASTFPSQLTLSPLLTFATENPGREAPLGKFILFSLYILPS